MRKKKSIPAGKVYLPKPWLTVAVADHWWIIHRGNVSAEELRQRIINGTASEWLVGSSAVYHYGQSYVDIRRDDISLMKVEE